MLTTRQPGHELKVEKYRQALTSCWGGASGLAFARYLNVTVLPEYAQSEGVAAVLDNRSAALVTHHVLFAGRQRGLFVL